MRRRADQIAAALVGLIAVADQRQRVHRLAADQHVQLHQIGFAIARQVIVERRVAARNALQPVVEIEHDFVERHLVGEHDARRREILEIFLHAALFLAQLQDAADRFLGRDDHGGDHRLFDLLNRGGRRKFRGVVHFHHFAVGGGDAVAHARRGGDQVDIEFALQALLRDLHVQQAEKSAAETEAQRHGIFRLVEKRGVVQLQFAQRVAQNFVIAGSSPGNRPANTMGLMASNPGSGGAGRAGFDRPCRPRARRPLA